TSISTLSLHDALPISNFAPGALDARQISAGKDAATGAEAVFINFGTYLYEHTGSTWTTGWKSVTSGVTGLSASQVEGDTVFAIRSEEHTSELQSRSDL